MTDSNSYKELLARLREPFPKGTVQTKGKGQYIPAQAYEERLEEIAGELWSWCVKGEPLIYERENVIQVVGTLEILGSKRDGMGFFEFQRFPEGKIKSIGYAIRSAEQDALRAACDRFQMGWRDLGKVGTSTSKISVKVERTQREEAKACLVCQNVLTLQEEKMLVQYGVNLSYCNEHVPIHLKK